MIKIHPIRKSIHPSINQSLYLENLLQLLLQVGVLSKGWERDGAGGDILLRRGGKVGEGGDFFSEDGEN